MTVDSLGIIAPHPPIMVREVGGSDADVTAASIQALSVAAGMLEDFAPATVVIMSPHAHMFQDAFGLSCDPRVTGDLGQFRAPDVILDVAGDHKLASAIMAACEDAGIPVACRTGSRSGVGDLDHGVLVPMSFLDQGHHYPLLVLSYCWLDYETHHVFGRLVARVARDIGRRVAFVASGDCSHRLKPGAPAGFSPKAALFDQSLVAAVRANDFGAMRALDTDLIDEAGECGLRSFITLGGFLEGTGVASRMLAYEEPWGVGYLTAVFADPGLLAEVGGTPSTGRKGGARGSTESPIVTLARATIESYVTTGKVPYAELSDVTLPERAGAFVSIHEMGDLRGCIGTIAPTRDSLAEEVVANAVSAATCDSRFRPIGEDELPFLDIKVDVLHEPEPVGGLADLDPGVYGVIVSSGGRRGLLLPDLEGIDTAEQQVDIARRKGGIGPNEPVSLERFKVDRYE